MKVEKEFIEEIKELLEPLFEKAYKEKLFFRSKYQGSLFSPDELKDQHKKESYLWGPVNWDLVSIKEEMGIIDRKINDLEEKKKRLSESYDKCFGGREND